MKLWWCVLWKFSGLLVIIIIGVNIMMFICWVVVECSGVIDEPCDGQPCVWYCWCDYGIIQYSGIVLTYYYGDDLLWILLWFPVACLLLLKLLWRAVTEVTVLWCEVWQTIGRVYWLHCVKLLYIIIVISEYWKVYYYWYWYEVLFGRYYCWWWCRWELWWLCWYYWQLMMRLCVLDLLLCGTLLWC